MMVERQTRTLGNYTKKAKSKPNSNKLKEKICFYFKNALFFAIILLEQKKVDKVFFVRQQTNLMKTRSGRGLGGDNWRSLLIDTISHRDKISKANNIVLY